MFETGATNAAVNDIVLTVINDGNGDACGFSYERPPKPQAVWNATPDAQGDVRGR